MSPRPTVVDASGIVRAAAPIFARKGFAATTREIAAAAGISEGSLYNYFPSKRELFLACTVGRERIEALLGLARRAGAGPLEPGLRRLARSLVGFMTEHMPVMLQLAQVGGARDLRRGPRLDLILAEQLFAPRVEAGELVGDPPTLSRCFLGLCQALAFQERVFGFPARDALDGFMKVFLDGARRAGADDAGGRRKAGG